MSIDDNIAGQTIAPPANDAECLREQARLFRALCESLQLFLDAVARRDVVGIEQQVGLQIGLCALIDAAQKGAREDVTDEPGAMEERREDARNLLRAVSEVRSHLQTARVLLPRLRRSTKVMLSVLGGDHSCSHPQSGNGRLA